MTEKWAEATEIARLLQKSSQKRIKIPTFNFVRANNPKRKSNIYSESVSSSSESHLMPPSSRKKRSDPKWKSKFSKSRYLKHRGDTKSIRCLQAKIRKYLASKFSVLSKKKQGNCSCTDGDSQCSLIQSQSSDNTVEHSPHKYLKSGECSDHDCCVSGCSPTQSCSSRSSSSITDKYRSKPVKNFNKQVEPKINRTKKEKSDSREAFHYCSSEQLNTVTCSKKEMKPLPRENARPVLNVKRSILDKPQSTFQIEKPSKYPLHSTRSCRAIFSPECISNSSQSSVCNLPQDKPLCGCASVDHKVTSTLSSSQRQLSSSFTPCNSEDKKFVDEESCYDPHLHRVVENSTNNFETLMHLVKFGLGTGILAMPQAFAHAGLITGIFFTVIIGVMITHCSRMLIQAQYFLCKQKRVPFLTYSESMVAALELGPPQLRRFSKYAGYVVNIFLIILQLSVCCVYIVFIAGNLKKIIDPFKTLPIEYHIVVILGPLIALNCIPNMTTLALYSTLANLLIIASLSIMVCCLLRGHKKSLEQIDFWGSLYTFPHFFGTTLFALTAVAAVTVLENNMKTPKDFIKPLGVLDIGMAMIVLIYVFIGSIGYLFCKSLCCDFIALNRPLKSLLVLAASEMYTIAILISYALQNYVLVKILWKACIEHRFLNTSMDKLRFWECILRILLCILTCLFAVKFHCLGLCASLLSIVMLGIVIPALLEFFVTMNFKFSVAKYMVIIKDFVLFVIGIAALIVFTTAAYLEILGRHKKDPNLS